jgi:hypothetical protein
LPRAQPFSQPGRLRVIWFVFLLPLFWLGLFSPPLAPVIPELGSSWCGALVHFSMERLQFGKDVVFTYGPLGHLITYVYTGELFRTRIVWEFVSTTIMATILTLSVIRLPALWRSIFVLCVMFFIWADGISDTLYFLVITCLAALLFRRGGSNRVFNSVVGALLGVFSLTKFTYFLLVIVLLATVLAYYRKQRRGTQAALLLFSFVASFLFCWSITSQNFQNLPSYLYTSWEISRGYKEAMGLPVANNLVLFVGVAAAVLSFLLCLIISFKVRTPSAVGAAIFIAMATCLSWNRAFIRADDHVLSFFCFCPVALLTIWIVVQPTGLIRPIGYLINVVVLLLCLGGMFVQRPSLITNCVSETTEKVRRSLKILGAFGPYSQELRSQLITAKRTYSLPRVQSEVGEKTIDVFGYEQGVALLNGLNYTPRPIFQSYSAYTPSLIALNTAFYSSASAPAYVLFKYQSIDNRYPSLDDAGVLRQLLFDYKPLFLEKGYWLWKRVQSSKSEPIATVTDILSFDSEHALPSAALSWIQLEIKPSLWGSLLNFLYKPPVVTITTTDRNGRRIDYRLVPSMASSGFIVNPCLVTPWQVLQTSIRTNKSSIVSFSAHIPPVTRPLFQPQFTCQIGQLPDIPSSEMDDHVRQISVEAFTQLENVSQDWLGLTFNMSHQTLLHSNSTNRFEGISPLNDSEFAFEENGLRIKSNGTDSQILLPRISIGTDQAALLRINLKTPADTGFQAFYLPAGETVYGNHVFNLWLRHGENTIYLFLAGSQMAGGRVRVDPGMVSGNYFLSDLEVRSVPPELLSDP